MDVQDTPARAQRAPQPHPGGSTPSKKQHEHAPKSANRRKHNQHGQSQSQPLPAWDRAAVNDASEGHFDSTGRFVSGHQDSSAIEESPAQIKSKKTRAKHNHSDNAGHTIPNHHTTPSHAIPVTTPAKIAYAGPTFHASPAASALPKPFFMSKSVPGETKPSSLQSRLDQETGTKSPSPALAPTIAEQKPAAVPPREESPLEFFFKADRAEKSRNLTPNAPATPNNKSNLSIAQSAPPGNNWPNVHNLNDRHHQRTESGHSQRGMFALELDGTAIQQQATRTSPSQGPYPATAPRPSSQAEDPIRKFLYETAKGSSPSPKPSAQYPQYGQANPPAPSPFYRPSPPQRSASGPTTPARNQQHNNGNLHYGNRNLSPLFQAAKRPMSSTASQAPHEQSRPSSQQNPSYQQWASIYQQPPGQHLTPPLDRSIDSHPPSMATRSDSYNSQPTSTPDHDTESMENDLRRILKLTASSGGATGVQG